MCEKVKNNAEDDDRDQIFLDVKVKALRVTSGHLTLH